MNSYKQQIKVLTAIGLALIAVVFFVAAFTPLGGQKIFRTKESAGAAPASTAASEAVRRVNINTADVKQLQALPDIGEAKAKRIIAYREAHGRFTDPAQLLEVDGIGEATYEKIKDLIYVE